MAKSRLVNRNVVAGRGRTSMRLEPELWDALYEI
ncbi:MAG: ribbon-helix-helix domain-containing protein, partial [Acetobacteraceae bacterium]|nr:ribbon-helix-helix domain-containing protein [Acetobacteraceae bacterium]